MEGQGVDTEARGDSTEPTLESHFIYPGSEVWADVPIPNIPSQEDVSGLGVPSPVYIPGYVFWSRGEQGPKTGLQAYADKISALMLAVHPLEHQDCRAPSPKELDGMRKRQKNLKILAKRREKPPKVVIPLRQILKLGSWTFLALVVVVHLPYAKRSPIDSVSAIGAGVVAGVLCRRQVEKNKRKRRLKRKILAVSPEQWAQRVRLLMDSDRRKPSQGPYWASLHSLHQPTEWFNSILGRLWPFYDAPISQNIMNAVDNVLLNVKPPLFSELKMHSLKFGSRAPQFVSMTTFSVSERRIVIHARMRFVGTDLQATVLGTMPAGKVYAGVKNLKLDARMRIELSEPLPAAPYFAAVTLAFLEPLDPVFSLKLETALLPEGLTIPIVKPILTNILSDKVFAGLFVWPNRLVIANGGQNPLVKKALPRLQPRLKGLLAVTVHRAHLPGTNTSTTSKPVAGLSVDGLHWYKTTAAEDPTNPVWEPEEEDETAAWRLPEASHHVLIPLKELDLDLQVAIATSDVSNSSSWRGTDNPSVVARTTINLHDLQEGEVVEGWFRLVPGGNRGSSREVEMQADPGQDWTPPWEREGWEAQPERMNRQEFDDFQGTFCANYGVPMPPMPPSRQSSEAATGVQTHPLHDIQEVFEEELQPSLLRAPARRHMFVLPAPAEASHAQPSPSASPSRPKDTSPTSHPALSPPQQRQASTSSIGRLNLAPNGAVYLTVRAVRAGTLKREFGVGEKPREDYLHDPDDASPASALMQVLRPWRLRSPVEGQRGCLWVKLHEGKNLSIWTAEGGYRRAGNRARPYDTFVRLRLASEQDESHTTETFALTKIITDNNNPKYNSEFEFLAERVSQKLEVRVMTVPNVAEGRLTESCVGRGHVWIDDLARCPDSKLQRLALDVRDPESSSIVTGTLIMDLEWIPLNAGPVGPPRMLRMLRDTRRGSFFVRLLCAWDLPPVDTQHMNCAASVRVTTGGREEHTRVVESMSPVWIQVQQFEYVGELAQVWLEVQHTSQGSTETVARTHISIEDLRYTPNEAVLITKCLRAPSGSFQIPPPMHSEDSTFSADDAASDASQTSLGAATTEVGSETGDAIGGLGLGQKRGNRVLTAAEAHARRAAACGSASVSMGSLSSDLEAPRHVLPNGWLMFEVAWRPYDVQSGTQHARNFTFPSVDRTTLYHLSKELHDQRHREFMRALKLSGPRRNAGLGKPKESAVVGEVGHCLRVQNLRAENLPKLDITGASDPYTMVTAQSEAGLQMFRTQTIWSTTFPIWEEAVDVYEAHTTGGHLEFQIWDDDKMRGDDLAVHAAIDAGATLLSDPPSTPTAAGRSQGGVVPAVPATPPQASAAPPTPLPLDRIIQRDVVISFPKKKHSFGVPKLFFRLIWVPQGLEAPWGSERGSTPLVPWRHTDLMPMKAHAVPNDPPVATVAAPPGGGVGGAACGMVPEASIASEGSIGPASAPRRGNLEITVVEVIGTIETRYPKYVTVRCNKGDAGKTSASMGSCEFNHKLDVMSNVSMGDVLVFKLKGRGMQKFLIGQATASVGDIVRHTTSLHHNVDLTLPLVGTTASLAIRWSWQPITQYSG